jgi:hypothetical protein
MQKFGGRPLTFFDLETYRDYFLCKFLHDETDTFEEYAMFPGMPLNRLAIIRILMTRTIIGFNSANYDCPILSYALAGATNQQLKDANDLIITRGLKPWEFRDQFGVQMPEYTDHVDISEVLPGVKISLKAYGGIIHAPTIQDLPIDPSASIAITDRMPMSKYCGNDLTTTKALYWVAVKQGRIALREFITNDIGIDVRSKSDAQISESIFRAKLPFKPQRVSVPNNHQFCYKMPTCVQFITPELQEVQRIAATAPFTVLDKDQATSDVDDLGNPIKSGIKMHADIAKIRVRHLGSSVYKFGAGGLHSQESSISHYADAEHELMDSDVASLYPSLILQQGLNPPAIGPAFQQIYRIIYDERLSAKDKAGLLKKEIKKLKAQGVDFDAIQREFELTDGKNQSGKTSLNGAYGKLGSKYSFLFAPELLIQVTLSGQLYLLMLIEALELNGIHVLSANTDGIVTRTPLALRDRRDAIMTEWMRQTGLVLEHQQYRSIHFRDVNSYIAVTLDGDAKRKGIFTPPGVGSSPSGSKAPNREICYDAVVERVLRGTPIENTIYRCTDIRKFVSVRNVKGGCKEAQSKVVRWYYGRGVTDSLHYKSNDNMVADSTGAVLAMTLPERLPADIDYEYYVRHANEVLVNIGITK